jgi:hypothetical protein
MVRRSTARLRSMWGCCDGASRRARRSSTSRRGASHNTRAARACQRAHTTACACFPSLGLQQHMHGTAHAASHPQPPAARARAAAPAALPHHTPLPHRTTTATGLLAAQVNATALELWGIGAAAGLYGLAARHCCEQGGVTARRGGLRLHGSLGRVCIRATAAPNPPRKRLPHWTHRRCCPTAFRRAPPNRISHHRPWSARRPWVNHGRG